MAGITGFTTNGIDRKTQPELLAELSDHLKAVLDENGNPVFGGCTTLDDPVANAGDPLVELGMATTASLHELWEGVENTFQNFDPSQASGYWLDTFHGCASGLTREPGESDAALQKRICERRNPAVPRFGVAASGLDGVSAADFVCTAYPPKIPAGSGMLVVKGEPDPDDIGDTWYYYAPPGKDLVGESFVDWVGPDGVCRRIRYQQACRVFVELCIVGRADPCGKYSLKDAAQTIIDDAKDQLSCRFGISVNGLEMMALGERLPGVFVQEIKVRRRPRQLVLAGTDGEPCADGVLVSIDGGDPEPWVSSNICGCCPGEVWCGDFECSTQLKPWEFPDFDAVFCVTEEATC